jgi:hypothetical protein
MLEKPVTIMRYRFVSLVAPLLFVTASAAMAAEDWKSYGYPQDRFVAAFPTEPVLSDQKIDSQKMLRHTQYWSDRGEVAYGVSAVRFQPKIIASDVPDTHLKRVIEGVGGSLECVVRGQREVSLPGATAREFVLEKCQKISGGVAKLRLYLAGDWLYQAMVLGYKAGLEDAADTIRFLDSFSITSQ